MKTLIIFFCGFFLFGGVQAGEVFRSVDSNGKVHYGDAPLPGTDDFERLKFGNEPVPDDGLPYESQVAQKNFPVSLYVFPNCGSLCQQARDFLNNRGIPFSEKNLVDKEDIDKFYKSSGGSEVPALTVGGTWLKGLLVEQWNKELDFAGYPNSAHVRPRTASPQGHTSQ